MEERLLALRQDESVREYRLLFETLVAPVDEASEAILEGLFVNGLKLEIRAEVRVLQPSGLTQIMEIAQRIGEKIHILQAQVGPGPPVNPTTVPCSSP